jgi:NAD(P)-dependent dehydrogenase (short-subunit alcohol dehydrogenase family)
MNSGPTVRTMPPLLGQTVAVIGGSAGIGLETTRRAHAEGAGVILVQRSRRQRMAAPGDQDAAPWAARRRVACATTSPA